MISFRGTPAALNYTYGPALIYRGPRTIDLIYRQGEPVVVVADMIPMDELRKIELTRVRGFVFEHGRATDEDLYNFLQTEKRASVIGCKGILDFVCDGDMLAVDGVEGIVALKPLPDVLELFQKERAKGPPTDRQAAIQGFARSMLQGLVEERAEKEARGEKVPKMGEVMSTEELKKFHKNAPGLIYQLLSGLPLPNSPTAGEHGCGHEHEGDADHAHPDEGRERSDGGDPDRADARGRAAAQRSSREKEAVEEKAQAERAEPVATPAP